ncbi:hypothetical protein [Deinococcus cavernae]|uniref:hypothetical protein n=1 Tax=Deinococcus cavernae TaxID=2320857 RepID=UPI001F27A998|nr:hypothetical protein [Deinococcus cavernae]
MGGLLFTLLLIAVSPNIMKIDPDTLTTGRHLIQANALFRLENPGIISIPAGSCSPTWAPWSAPPAAAPPPIRT